MEESFFFFFFLLLLVDKGMVCRVVKACRCY